MTDLTDEDVAGWEPYEKPLTDADVADWQELPSSSGPGAFARGAAEGLFPTTGGLAAGLGAGALATAATGNPWIGVPTGLAVGLGAGELLNRGQDWLMEKAGLREGEGNFSRAQQIADEAEHPYLKTAGAALPSALLLKPTGAMVQRAAGAAIGGGITAADELIREGHIDMGKVGIGAATGFALPTANRAGAAVEAAGARAGAKAAPYVPASLKRAPPQPEVPEARIPMDEDVRVTDPQDTARADWEARQSQESSDWPPRLEGPPSPLEGEVLPHDLPQDPGRGGPTFDLDPSQYSEVPPDTTGLQVNARIYEWRHNVDVAAYQLEHAFPEAKPFWAQALTHAQTKLIEWEAHGQGKADPNSHTDASQGPDSKTNAFTPADSDRANDSTITSVGSAQEQPRAARVAGAGNPVGAQMAGRETGFTPTKYPKANATPQTDYRISIGGADRPVAPDIQAALSALEPSKLNSRPGTKPPEPAPAPPEVPVREPPPTAPEVPEVTGAVTPRPTLSLPGRPNGAPREVKLSRGERAIVPERPSIAETPTDRYAPVTAPKEAPRPEAVFSPKEQENLLKVIADIPRTSENARTGDEQYRNVAQVGENKVQLGRGEVGKRRQTALDAFTSAAREMPEARFNLDPSKENVAAVLKHATDLFESAKAKFGGKDPTERGVGYTPKDKPPEFNLVAAARTFVNKPTPANMKPYVEALALKGKIGKKEYTGTSTRQVEFTDAVEADLKPSENREEITPRKPTGDKDFDTAQRELERWVDDLDNNQWAALDAHHEGNLAATVKTTRNPEIALKQFRNDLQNLKVRPERVAEEEIAPEKAKISEQDELAALIGEQEADANPVEAKADEVKYRGVKDALHDFLWEDVGQGGFLDVGKIAQDLKAFAKRMMASTAPAAHAPAAPGATPPVTPHVAAATARVKNAAMEYGKAFMKPGFVRLAMRQSQFKFAVRAEIRAATKDTAALPTRAEQNLAFQTHESGGDMSTLPQKTQDYWNKWIQPHIDAAKQDHIEYLQMARTMKILGWEKLKDPKDNGPGYARWMPHVKGEEFRPKQEADMAVSQTLSPQAGHAKTREYFSLQNVATGERLLYHLDPKDADHITILRNGAPRKVKTGTIDMAEIGTDIPLTVKGVNGVWKVDNATVPETRNNAGRNKDGTPKVDYIENPHLAVITGHTNVKLALERMRALKNFIDDPKFISQVYAKKSDAEAAGKLDDSLGERKWVEHTALPELKGRWMPPAYNWHLQDFVKRGFDVAGFEEAKARLDNFAANSAKIFFMVGGPVHGVNVFDKWFIGRGKDWLTPQGWKGLGKFPEAIRSVTSQDATQHEMGENGMNMLYVHTMAKDVLPEAARALGEDMTANAWKWDPIAKMFGVTTQQMSRNIYKGNSAYLWYFTDMLATQRYLELKGQGLSPKEAVKKLQHSADDYVMQATYMGEGQTGRMIQKVLSDPSISWFSAFHQHNFHMLGRMMSTPFKRGATTGERVDAAVQMALLGAMTSVVYPLLSQGYAALTDNKHAEFEKRGISRVASTFGDVLTGHKGPEDAIRNVFTPSSVFDTAVRVPQNQRFDNKKIINHMDLRNPRNIPKAVGQGAEFAAQQYASPYKVLSTAAERPGATVGSVAKRFGESAVGLKTPTPQAVMHDAREKILQAREARSREKKPAGFLESAGNWLSKRRFGD